MKCAFLMISIILLSGCSDAVPSSYKVGDDNLKLSLISGSDVYLDQYQRLWALIATGNEDTPFKAVPAANNICLEENIDYYPFSSIEEMGKYIAYGDVCRLKQTPYQAIEISKSSNSKLKAVLNHCPEGLLFDDKHDVCIKS